MADDLRRFLKGEPIQARPVGQVERVGRWCKRNPLLAGSLTAVAAMLVVGTVVAWLLAAWAVAEKGRADEKAALADAIATDAEANLYAARMKVADSDWENANVGRVFDMLEPYRQTPAGKPDLRGWEWYHLDRLCHLELRTFKGHTDWVWSVAFSPDGRRLAWASQDKTVKVWDTASGQEPRTLKGHTNIVGSVVFSPDGRQLASASSDKTIKLWDARPWTPELRRQCESLGLLQYWCPKSPSKEQVSERIRADKGIKEEVRQEALSLLEEYWPRYTQSQANR